MDRTGSKGNQLKFKEGNKWYKADYLGYEGASEYFVSELLKQSNFSYFVKYNLEDVSFEDHTFKGCVSDNFLKDGERLITVENLCKMTKDKTMDKFLENLSLEDKIKKFVSFIETETGLTHFGEYLTLMLKLDSITMNDDRHFNNIAVIEKDGKFRYCPIFDNGGALLSDTQIDYPYGKSIYGLMANVKAKPFFSKFDNQMEKCQKLYGPQLQLNKNIDMSSVLDEIEKTYDSAVRERIEDIYNIQKSFYSEFFSEKMNENNFFIGSFMECTVSTASPENKQSILEIEKI